MIRPFFWRREAPTDATPPDLGENLRVYAIGDIHGCQDLFCQLLDRIAADEAGRPPLPRLLVLLGDLMDRGPDSAQVIEHAMALARSGAAIRFLKGNHEEVFVAAARGGVQSARFFRRIGGVETLASYGLMPQESADMDDEAIARWMLNHIPRDHVDFLDGFETMLTAGDYLFVHAGVRPHVPLDRQDPVDLRWIKGDFLDHRDDHGKMIVHGHHISDVIDIQANRIGIDTGAFRSGRLTAIGLEGQERWFLQTR